MNLQMDPLDNPLTTRPILTGCEMSIEPYPNSCFGCIDDPDPQLGNGSVLTRTRTRSAGPEPFLTLCSARVREEPHKLRGSMKARQVMDKVLRKIDSVYLV